MHQYLTLKVWAHDEEEARNIAQDVIDESIKEGNSGGWDYCGEIRLIEPKDFKKYGVTSYAEFERVRKSLIHQEIDNHRDYLRSDLQTLLARDFLTKDDVPLLVGTDDKILQTLMERVSKSKRDKKKPSFDEIVDKITYLLMKVAKKDYEDGMILYRLNKLNKIQGCLMYPNDLDCTLQCNDNYFAEVTTDNKKGKKAFYYMVDRHF